MIKLYKDETKKNNRIKEIILDMRTRPHNWRHQDNGECLWDIVRWYDVTPGMARKIVWLIRGDGARQSEIRENFGKEYAMY